MKFTESQVYGIYRNQLPNPNAVKLTRQLTGQSEEEIGRIIREHENKISEKTERSKQVNDMIYWLVKAGVPRIRIYNILSNRKALDGVDFNAAFDEVLRRGVDGIAFPRETILKLEEKVSAGETLADIQSSNEFEYSDQEEFKKLFRAVTAELSGGDAEGMGPVAAAKMPGWIGRLRKANKRRFSDDAVTVMDALVSAGIPYLDAAAILDIPDEAYTIFRNAYLRRGGINDGRKQQKPRKAKADGFRPGKAGGKSNATNPMENRSSEDRSAVPEGQTLAPDNPALSRDIRFRNPDGKYPEVVPKPFTALMDVRTVALIDARIAALNAELKYLESIRSAILGK